MKTRSLIAIAVTAALFSACIPSVNPFYTEKDVVFDARLLGEWQEKDSKEEPQVWKFEKADNKAYKLTVTEKEGKRGEFDAHLFKLKQADWLGLQRDEYFLDLVPTECEFATNQADLVSFSMFPGHLLARVPQLEPELKLAFFDFDWLQKLLEKNPKALAHHKEDKRIVLTAGTRDLQRFVLKHLGEDELFETPGEFVRKPNNVPTATPR